MEKVRCIGGFRILCAQADQKVGQELEKMECQTIPGRVDRKHFYEQFYGTKSYDGRN